MKLSRQLFLVSVGMLIVFFSSSLSQAAQIGNFQSAFRTSGMDLIFNYNFSAWDGGTEVFPPDFSRLDASFREFGTFNGGSGETGLGKIEVVITRAATAVGTVMGSILAYFDLEIDVSVNDFFNEFGAVSGTLGGVKPDSWEIDEPGSLFGDIPFNFEDGILDDVNELPAGLEDDVAVAMGWDVVLGIGQRASLTLVVSDAGVRAATSSFFITQTDPDSVATVTFSGALETIQTPEPIPEPSTILLFSTGLAGLLGWRWKKGRQI